MSGRVERNFARPIRLKVDIDKQLRWRDEFVELAEAATEMNRYSGKQIVIGDPAIGHQRISGVFRTGNLERLAAIVGELLPIRQHPLPDGDIELNIAVR